MPMQPKPISETSRPLLPSLRFCIVVFPSFSGIRKVGFVEVYDGSIAGTIRRGREDNAEALRTRRCAENFCAEFVNFGGNERVGRLPTVNRIAGVKKIKQTVFLSFCRVGWGNLKRQFDERTAKRHPPALAAGRRAAWIRA